MNTVANNAEFKIPNWDNVLAVIQGAHLIEKHVDFYRWMQIGVGQYIPHNLVISVWGNFDSGPLNYDITSSISGITDQDISSNLASFDFLMKCIYRRWLDNDKNSYALDNRELTSLSKYNSVAYLGGLKWMQSIIVHGVRDRRGDNDCIYVFFGNGPVSDVRDDIMNLMMPYIDIALRRVECPGHRPSPTGNDNNAHNNDISDREQDVMEWIVSGKTNIEIGLILSISKNTVKNHIKKIFMKLDVTGRAQAVAKYHDLKLPPKMLT
ncbi:MAG: helix-turn-helix transcriptional regulator [Thiobacillus sp.]|nr:helix-turn-helix transcriptional regulator [Thiobacillus sp.]